MNEIQKATQAIEQAMAALAIAHATLGEFNKADEPKCSHPPITRRPLATFGDEEAFMCGVCEEIVNVQHT